MSAIEHPAKGMTKAQVEAFERIAVMGNPECAWPTIDALLKAGLVERGPSEQRRDALGVFTIPSFYVPLPIHIRWCEWCTQEQVRSRRVEQPQAPGEQ